MVRLCLYGAFATIIGRLFFPAEDPSTVMLAAFATYGTALVIRPVGACSLAEWLIFAGAVPSFCRSFAHGRSYRGGRISAELRSRHLAPVTLILLRAAKV